MTRLATFTALLCFHLVGQLLLANTAYAGSYRAQCGLLGRSCGCDEKCLVYRNCCEDFIAQCPDVANITRDKYGFMSSAESRCSKYNMFVISGCSSDGDSSSMTETGYLSNFTVSSGLKLPELMPTGQHFASLDPLSRSCWESALQFHALLWSRLPEMKGRPEPSEPTVSEATPTTTLSPTLGLAQTFVSDRSTGFVYANLGVFMCYARFDSVPCLWGVNVKSHAISPQDDLRHLSLASIFQSPPSDDIMPRSSFSICDAEAKDNCDKNSTFYSEELEEKCHSFTSTITSKFSFFMTYKNRYCQQCIEGNMDGTDAYLASKLDLPGISVLLVLSGTHLEPKRSDANQDIFPSWTSARCALNDPLSCVVIKCHRNLVKRSDGICKNSMALHLAVPLLNSNVSGISRDHSPYERVGRLLQCVAVRHGAWDVDHSVKSHHHGVIYRLGTENTVYGTKL